MRVNFLSADVRLSKQFEQIAPGTYKETSYPHVANFTSIERDVSDLDTFYKLIVSAANEGCCLLKGRLDKPLANESRAGHTDSSALTEWICLDVDFTVTDKSPEQFLDELDPAFTGVSFIFHRSASMGIKTHNGWRGHFFLLLASPQSPQALKQWLITKNLRTRLLRSAVGLSASGGALTYPLDVSTCQNDKLLFIAPPVCKGFEDPLEDRFQLYKRQKERVQLDLSEVSAAHNTSAQQTKIAELRATNNLEPKTFQTLQQKNREILVNPDPVMVTGKQEARGFVYLNLNGGDSWAYYFPVSNPEILFNFKGEPCMYMWDVDKDIYNEYAAKSQAVEGAVPFGFLWPDDDVYYRGFANPETRELVWLRPTGSKAKLRDFFVQHGVQLPKGWAVDEWQLDFDPTIDGYADFVNKEVNTYRRTEYIVNARTTNAGIPPTIDKILTSVCVEPNVKDYFLNWLACVFQTRMKTNTAWIFQGVQGTGKGVLFSHIIAPLLGREYCHEMTMDRLDDDFNSYLSDNIILFIDEAKISDSKNGDRLLNRIKNLITEPEQHIRAMRRNAVIRKNYSNIILASNYDDIIPLEHSDRRFNVAPRQENPIQIEYEDIVRIGTELAAFADYLHSYEVSARDARVVLMSEARERLIKLSETTIDSFFQAIRTGNLGYFTQYIDSSVKADLEGVRYHDYALVVKRWIEGANKEMNVSRAELRTCYQFLQNVSISTTKFSRMVAKYNIEIVPVRIEGAVTRGIHGMIWELSAEEIELHNEATSDKVVRLHK